MPEKKSGFRGGDPKAMQLKSAATRVRNKAIREAEAQEQTTTTYADLELGKLGPAVLRELVTSRTTPPSVRATAAKYLLDVPDEDAESHWQNSVQVRPDYEPPEPKEVVGVWLLSGELTRDDLRALLR